MTAIGFLISNEWQAWITLALSPSSLENAVIHLVLALPVQSWDMSFTHICMVSPNNVCIFLYVIKSWMIFAISLECTMWTWTNWVLQRELRKGASYWVGATWQGYFSPSRMNNCLTRTEVVIFNINNAQVKQLSYSLWTNSKAAHRLILWKLARQIKHQWKSNQMYKKDKLWNS